MTDVTNVATELKTILAALADVDQSSLDNYVPMVTTQKVALLIVPFQQTGIMVYTGTGPHNVAHAHEIPCEFWIKVANASVAAAMERGRDICLQAMLLLAANKNLNGTVQQFGSAFNGTQGRIGRYTIAPRYEDAGHVTFIIATLFVPIEIRETVQ